VLFDGVARKGKKSFAKENRGGGLKNRESRGVTFILRRSWYNSEVSWGDRRLFLNHCLWRVAGGKIGMDLQTAETPGGVGGSQRCNYSKLFTSAGATKGE